MSFRAFVPPFKAPLSRRKALIGKATEAFPTCKRRRHNYSLVPCASIKVFRPSLDDVDRISRGDAARRRGTGSRAVPHRLNREERAKYERAQRIGVLELPPNEGHRRERRGSPLLNIWRQWCDAQARPAVYCLLAASGPGSLFVDVSTLRNDYRSFGGSRLDVAGMKSVFDGIVGRVGVMDGGSCTDEELDQPIWTIPSFSVLYEIDDASEVKKKGRQVGSFCVERLTKHGSGTLAAVAVSKKGQTKRRRSFEE